MPQASLSWFGILRLSLVQTSLGAIVVLTTSTLNRVMVVELALPAMVPGALVALHYAAQMMRPRFGYGSDVGRRCTPWIIGGMAVLAIGGVLAAVATAMMSTNLYAGLALATVAFLLIGGGVSAAGTTLLVLLAKRTQEERRAAAATVVWLMMIAGFAVTAILAGRFLDPYTPQRLVAVSATASAIAFLVSVLAITGVEGRAQSASREPAARRSIPFGQALAEVWADPTAKLFTIFIFLSMVAYSAQDLILEPFAGTIFGYTPGQSTGLSGVQHGGVFLGMVLVALATTLIGGRVLGSLKAWIVGGCVASAVALIGVTVAGYAGPVGPLRTIVFILGVANGAFAVAAIGAMMGLAGAGGPGREGTRMGLWGAAQGIAFGIGGFSGTALADIARALIGSPAHAYAVVFILEALVFVASAIVASRIAIPTVEAKPRRSIAEIASRLWRPLRVSAQGGAAS